MQLKRTIFTFLSALLILICTWFLLFFSQGLLEENTNENLNYVPMEATFAVRLDGRELAEETLFSVFLDSRDDLVLKLIEKRVSEGLSGEGQFKNYGIDVLSDIVLFEIPFEGQTIFGLLVNVSNGRLFERKLDKKNTAYAYNNRVGVILRPAVVEDVDMSKLETLAQEIIENPGKKELSQFNQSQTAATFFEMYTNHDRIKTDSYFRESKLNFDLEQKNLIVYGSAVMKHGKNKLATIHSAFQPKGLHITTSIIPSSVNDSLNNWLEQFEIVPLNIEELSMNYFGSVVVNHSSGFFVVPQMDLLLTCKENYSIEHLFKNDSLQHYLDYKLGKDYVQFQNEKLYFKQITPNSFYVGIHQYPDIIPMKEGYYFTMTGNISPLTDIKGGGLMTTILEMLPAFQAAKSLDKGTKNIQFSIVKSVGNRAEMNGKISFYEGKRPLNEVMKFLLLAELL